MNWDEWYKHYDSLPGLQERLRIVREQIVAALNECPAGQIQIVSICAGDGRDLIGALQKHPRRNDVSALLLDNHAESIARGEAAAKETGLQRQLRFLDADAAQAKNYLGAVPADLVLLSGFLGHLPHRDVPALINSLPMFCKTGGQVIWNRHLILHDGPEQILLIRGFFRQTSFEEIYFTATDLNGFAIARVRFAGKSRRLEPSRVLFEFAGLDRFLSAADPPETKTVFDRETRFDAIAREEIPVEAENSIPARFAQMVETHPSRPALGGGAWRPTYAELDAVTNRLANVLLSRGGNAGGRMALLMRHDAPLIAAALAVLKAGKAVVVLNPTDPPVRLKQILEDADPDSIVTDSSNKNLAGQIAQKNHGVIYFENEISRPAPNPGIKIAPTDIASLIYTSGSTGQPKGVVQTHRNIVHNVLRLSRGMNLTAEDRIILLGSPSGGQGMATTWCALLNGAALFPFPAAEKGVTGLADWIEENQITIFVTSVSIFRHFIQTLKDGEHFPTVRLVRFGSEPATADDFAAYRKYFAAGCVLLNSFSSTETGNITQHFFTPRDRVAPGRLPVGREAAGMGIRLLDEQGSEVRQGEIGEITVRSHFLSPGYWRNESLTAERFSAGGGPGDSRVFRTGDLGRRAADGSLMFAGRKDTRVKIHGYRIELSEIEEALAHQPEVAGAVVCPREALNNDLQLVAYVVLRPGGKCTAEILRRVLRSTLPGYMVPGHFVFLEKFPLTPHGKIDRRALPPPQPGTKSPLRGGAKTRDVIEGKLARIWESVLGVSRVGRHDDFFDLGGTSLQSVEVLLHIEETFSVSLPPSALVEHSTIERLATVIAGRAVAASPTPLVCLRSNGGRRPLFLIHNGAGEISTYGQLARLLPDRPIYGLQSVGLQGERWPLTRIPAMARLYLREIIAKDPTGPYLLVGTCMGGRVAFEIAQMLIQQGRSVGLLAMIDAKYPTPSWQSHKLSGRLFGSMRNTVRDAFRMLRWSLIRGVGLGRSARWLPDYRRFVFNMNGRANRFYKPSFYPGTITLFVPAISPNMTNLRMGHHANDSRVITIPGNHSGLFVRPAVNELARLLQIALELAEGTSLRAADHRTAATAEGTGRLI